MSLSSSLHATLTKKEKLTAQNVKSDTLPQNCKHSEYFCNNFYYMSHVNVSMFANKIQVKYDVTTSK